MVLGGMTGLDIIDDEESKGIKHDNEKPLMALIPAEALEEEAAVWTYGMNKYAAFNWTKGLTYLRVLSAAMRHLVAIIRGEDRDPETGLLHAAHVRCCMGMIIYYSKKNRTELDDRLKDKKSQNAIQNTNGDENVR